MAKKKTNNSKPRKNKCSKSIPIRKKKSNQPPVNMDEQTASPKLFSKFDCTGCSVQICGTECNDCFLRLDIETKNYLVIAAAKAAVNASKTGPSPKLINEDKKPQIDTPSTMNLMVKTKTRAATATKLSTSSSKFGGNDNKAADSDVAAIKHDLSSPLLQAEEDLSFHVFCKEDLPTIDVKESKKSEDAKKTKPVDKKEEAAKGLKTNMKTKGPPTELTVVNEKIITTEEINQPTCKRSQRKRKTNPRFSASFQKALEEEEDITEAKITSGFGKKPLIPSQIVTEVKPELMVDNNNIIIPTKQTTRCQRKISMSPALLKKEDNITKKDLFTDFIVDNNKIIQTTKSQIEGKRRLPPSLLRKEDPKTDLIVDNNKIIQITNSQRKMKTRLSDRLNTDDDVTKKDVKTDLILNTNKIVGTNQIGLIHMLKTTDKKDLKTPEPKGSTTAACSTDDDTKLSQSPLKLTTEVANKTDLNVAYDDGVKNEEPRSIKKRKRTELNLLSSSLLKQQQQANRVAITKEDLKRPEAKRSKTANTPTTTTVVKDAVKDAKLSQSENVKATKDNNDSSVDCEVDSDDFIVHLQASFSTLQAKRSKEMQALNAEMAAKDKMIQELLKAHRTEKSETTKVVEPPASWDHSALKEPLLVQMAWEQMVKNVDNIFPQVMASLQDVCSANPADDPFDGMLNFDNVTESGISSELVFKYFHLLEKSSDVKALRPFPLMSQPVKNAYGKKKMITHRLLMNDFQDLIPITMVRECRLIFALVVMDIGHSLPHFSLLVVDNEKKRVRHFCSLKEKLVPTSLTNYLTKVTKIEYTHGDEVSEHYQDGSYDCGLFVCQNAKQLALNLPTGRITQENMAWFRKMMVIELTKNIVFQWSSE
jgi:hypothetical protein